MATGESRPVGPSASWEVLRRRGELMAALRAFFVARGFLEVETPLLCRDSVVDLHLEPFRVEVDSELESGLAEYRWLQTSPEFCLKRLVASGAEAIFEVTRAFRRGEIGPLHNPEFTMVEWYRVGDDLWGGIDLLAELAVELLPVDGVERVEYAELFRRGTGMDPFSASDEELSSLAASRGLATANRATRDDCLEFLFDACVAPELGVNRPVIVYYYPASQAALARLDPADGRRAERFELFYCGVELANGYHELTDASEWRRRADRANRERVARGREAISVESALLAAMEAGLPSCSGVALGFDRLVMTALGKRSLAEVMAFDWSRA